MNRFQQSGFIVLLWLAGMLLAEPSSAQDDELAKYGRIKEDSTRLACYDKLARRKTESPKSYLAEQWRKLPL